MNRYMAYLVQVALIVSLVLPVTVARGDEKVNLSDRLADRADTFLHLDIGGYGDHVFVLYQKDGGDAYADIQRFSLLIGYEFADWIHLASELELEHALTGSYEGQFGIEELRLDFLLTSAVNVRAGRIVLPSTQDNLSNEPVNLYSVQIPEAVNVVVPALGFGEGIGVFGKISPALYYEAYVTSGREATEFTPGSVGGSQLGTTTDITDPAVSAKLGFTKKWDRFGKFDIGLFGYHGIVETEPDSLGQTDETPVSFAGAEMDYRPFSRLHLRGWVGHTFINDPNALLPGVAEHLYGWYVQGAYNVLPAGWKRGKLKESSLYIFGRYSDYDTQYRVPDNIWPDTRFNRNSITAGFAFFATPRVVIKADYENRWSVSEIDPPDLLSIGLGWMF